MNTILVIIGLLLVGAAVTVYLVKKGKIKDSDGDYIPDAVEDAVEDVKEFAEDVKETAAEVKRRAKAVKQELKDVVEEAKDVADALKGKVTKSKLRSMTKKELLDHSENDLGQKLDSSLSKSNIINKVYSIHQSK
jgi:F0F1-type ATP synthase membrane subunit b/b'